MKVKCFACAVVAGTAMSAMAMAGPDVQQAGGGVTQARPAPRLAQPVQPPKGHSPGKARYWAATKRWEILQAPSDSASAPAPAVRGPGPAPLWDNIFDDASGYAGFYFVTHNAADQVTFPNGNETFDWGRLCWDTNTLATHTIQAFQFAYGTTEIAPIDGSSALGVTIAIYDTFDPMCVGANGGGGCLATNANGFIIGGLPGNTDGGADVWILIIDLGDDPDTVPVEDFSFSLPGNEFGYGLSAWTGFTTGNAGPAISLNNIAFAPGAQDAWDQYDLGAPQQVYSASWFFGGDPFAQWSFSLYGTADNACPAPTLGACCLPDGNCLVATDSADCLAQGGLFQYIGAPCGAPISCAQPPANDECASAELIPDFGQYAYDNSGATDSADADPVGCGAPQGRDVWFEWQADCNGPVTVSTCLITTTDDLIAVYSGSCGSLVEVSCDDDGCGVGGGPSTASFTAVQDTTYYFRIGTWAGSAGGMNLFDLIDGGCVPGPAYCDADWCRDGFVGVPDIFCFLNDWFSDLNGARSYGGTPGVPAIFAFLAEWFGTPQGACVP